MVGLVPALHASRGDVHIALQQGARHTAGGHQLTRRTLVVAEVALALVLIGFGALTALFTFPLAFHLGSLAYRLDIGDAANAIRSKNLSVVAHPANSTSRCDIRKLETMASERFPQTAILSASRYGRLW